MLQLQNTGLDSLKTATEKVFHKTSEFLGDKIAGVVANSYGNKIVKIKSVEEIITRKKRRNIKRVKASIIKMQPYKISNLLKDSSVSQF